ncbi:PREDICTED: mucin-13 [Charadrius vociferus]|nr:PREDICTED: mucin-13 [Charadrius vociferus]
MNVIGVAAFLKVGSKQIEQRITTFAQVTFDKPISKVQLQLMCTAVAMDVILPGSKGDEKSKLAQQVKAALGNVPESTTATPEPTPISGGDPGPGDATDEPPTETTPGGDPGPGDATDEPPTETTPGNFCYPHPCGTKLAKCIALYSGFTCQCEYGFYYKEKNCYPGKIFPGVIMLNASYDDSVETVNSTQYEEVFERITMFFANALTNLSGFEQTVITNIQSPTEVRASPSTNVTVINLFTENANVTNVTVSMAITNATKDSPYVSEYRVAAYCEAFNCDKRTTDCVEQMYPECKCKSNFSSTQWDVLSCSDCSKDCTDEENEYCAKEEEIPVCKCKPDFQRNDKTCVPCPVGYSGENCNNNRELILIIVGTVFGAIILSLVIAVSVVSVRAKHKQDPEKKSLIKSGYSNPNTSDDRQSTMFPRVQTTSGHANPGYQPNNPYEMRSPNRGRFPDRDYDDMYEISREPEGFRMQSRY